MYNRNVRQAIAMLVAYAMAAHLIFLAFATTAMALGMQGRRDSAFVGLASTKQLIMVLCRPSALWMDADDADMPDDTHLRGCCGLCAVQSAGLWEVPTDFSILLFRRQSTAICWNVGRSAPSGAYRIAPIARGPPA